MLFLQAILLVCLVITSACGQNSSFSSESKLDTIFGESSIRLVSEKQKAKSPSAKAVGNIMRYADDPSSGQKFAFSKCSGISISETLVLTASHCADSALLFDQYQIADEASLNLLTFYVLGDILRLMFEGEMITAASQAPTNELLGAPIYLNQEMDFVIYRGPKQQSWLDLNDQGSSAAISKLQVYGHPHGAPFSISDKCEGRISENKSYLMHTCDALSGNSGGLISDEFDRPLALHLAGPTENSGAFYESNGRSETPAELASKEKCFGTVSAERRGESREWSQNVTCEEWYGHNRSLLLSSIWEKLKTEAPLLYQELFSKPG